METRFLTKAKPQTTSAIRRAPAAAAGAGALLLAGTAQAALQDRDRDGDTVVDAFYDTDLDITWLRNADVNGPMNWDTAVAWVDGFSFAGYDDWRLPIGDVTCLGYFEGMGGDEMGHLWYVELGNPAGGPMTNTGSFKNLQSDYYWSGTEFVFDPGYALFFHTGLGVQNVDYKSSAYYAMAVRPGDVVPEPQTVVLLLAGLGVLALAARRRPR